MIERIPIADRTSWLQLRVADLTASDIPAVAGLDPRRTHLSVWAEKSGLVPGARDNKIMRRGRWLEPAVIEALRERQPTWKLKRARVYLRDPSIRMGATPDAVAVDPEREGVGIIQCKVVSRPVFQREWDGKPPLRYELQTLAEAHLSDATWACVAALEISTYSAELHLFDVPRHEAAEERLRGIVRNFWKCVEAGHQPRADYTKDTEVLEALYDTPDPGKLADLTGDNLVPVILDERQRLKAEIKAREARIDEINAELVHKIGAAESAIIPGWKVTRKIVHRDESYTAATSYRQLRVTDRRETEGSF